MTVIDRDEYGEPVTARYKRLGAGCGPGSEQGVYVRFIPGFGLNVTIGIRQDVPVGSGKMQDSDRCTLSIGGWERLCELVDEWRAREATRGGRQLRYQNAGDVERDVTVEAPTPGRPTWRCTVWGPAGDHA